MKDVGYMMNQLALGRIVRRKGVMQTIMRTSAANMLILLLGTAISIATARLFGVEGKGEFSAILFWPTFLAGLVGFGLPTSLIYNMKTAPGQAAEFVRAGFLFQIPVSLIAGIVAWIGLPSWLGHYPAALIPTAQWYTVLTLPLLLAVNLISALAQSLDKFTLYNGLRLYVPLSNLAGLMALWAAGMLNLHLAAAVFFATSLMVVAWSLFSLRHDLKLKPQRSRIRTGLAAAKPLFGYGSRVYGVELLGTLYSQFDKIVILSLLTPRAFGLYTVVYTLSRMFNVVQTAISNVIFPKVTGLNQDQVISTVGRAFRLSFMLMMIAVVPSIFIGRFLLGLLFGQAFLEASGAFYLLSFECILGGGSWILASSFNALGRPGLVLTRQAVALAITVALIFVFTPLYGLNGIALALLAGAVIRLLITVAAMRIVFKVRVAGLFFDKGDFRYLSERLAGRMKAQAEGRASGE